MITVYVCYVPDFSTKRKQLMSGHFEQVVQCYPEVHPKKITKSVLTYKIEGENACEVVSKVEQHFNNNHDLYDRTGSFKGNEVRYQFNTGSEEWDDKLEWILKENRKQSDYQWFDEHLEAGGLDYALNYFGSMNEKGKYNHILERAKKFANK